MKPFLSYMLEYADKTYEYKIKLANVEPTNKVLDQIERALAPFEIASISAPKHQILSKNFKNYLIMII